MNRRISVVTPTYLRPLEVCEMLTNLTGETELPYEVIIIDGAPESDSTTQAAVLSKSAQLPFRCRYLRRGGGTAMQRNAGLDVVQGDFVAFVDDDIRLEPDYFERILEVFEEDRDGRVGGIAGYIVNQYLDPNRSPRWRWYRRFHLFSTYEPGRYDYKTGYTINRYLQPPHDGVREIDWVGSNAAVWRRAVFEGGLRFDDFFIDYGVLEDAHLALRAGRRWKILECGRARCLHLRAPGGRVSKRRIAWKSAVNYRYVFLDIVPHRRPCQELRFWLVQLFDMFRIAAYALRKGDRSDWGAALGKAEGILSAMRLRHKAI